MSIINKSNVTKNKLKESYLIIVDDCGYLTVEIAAVDALRIDFTKVKSEAFVYDSFEFAVEGLSLFKLSGNIRKLSECHDLI